MSKQSKLQGEISWGPAYVIGTNAPDRLVGKIFAVVETMGLKDTQEKSAKDIIRTVVWEIFSDAVYILPDKYNEIRKETEIDGSGSFNTRGAYIEQK